ncbi:MAG: hypothetical protein R3E66_12145 [bacterium]
MRRTQITRTRQHFPGAVRFANGSQDFGEQQQAIDVAGVFDDGDNLGGEPIARPPGPGAGC